MTTINVNLTDEMAAFVERELASGDYASASELVREGLRLLRREHEMEALKLEVLRREIDVGLAQAERGEFSERSAREIAGDVLRGNDG
jgi:antitoxin ParD1/3/4